MGFAPIRGGILTHRHVLALTLAAATLSAAAKEKTGSVTYSKDVAPIFNRRCVECHRPGEVAPMSLLNYKEIRPWAAAIKERVITRAMPPWLTDPLYKAYVGLRFTKEPVNKRALTGAAVYPDGRSEVKGPNNKFNPDPAKLGRWGDQTWEETMIGLFDFKSQNLLSQR